MRQWELTDIGDTADWRCSASSRNGRYIVAVTYGGYIYTSDDYGVTLTERGTSQNWIYCAIDDDGDCMMAITATEIYVSVDFGVTWELKKTSSDLTSCAMSSDGSKMYVSKTKTTTAPVGHWKLDETSGTTAADSSGNGLDGTATPDGAWTTGKIDNAFNCETRERYISVAHDPLLNVGSAFTMAAWFYCTANYGYELISKQGEYIITKSGTTSIGVYFFKSGGGQYETIIFSGVPNNQWVHIAAVYTGTQIKTYIDFVLRDTISAPDPIATGTNNLTIGGADYLDPQYIWAGLVDDVQIYDSALTADEIMALYGGVLYSADTGATWNVSVLHQDNYCVSSSSDGTKLLVASNAGYLYTSTDTGATWTARDSVRNWISCDVSTDGTRMIAADAAGYLYISEDSGVTWTARNSERNWSSVSMNRTGKIMLGSVNYGADLYYTWDYGATWLTYGTSELWNNINVSGDGSKVTAAAEDGKLWVSVNPCPLAYWLCSVLPPGATLDSETLYAANIIDLTTHDGTQQKYRLLDISGIESDIDIYESNLAKVNEVVVTYQNIDGTIVPRDYIGGQMKIYLGTTAAINGTWEILFFTGSIIEAKATRDKIEFTCQGNAQYENKEIGEVMPETAEEKSRGKIIPISHGDWSDEDAYLPMTISSPWTKSPTLYLNSQPQMSALDNYIKTFIFDETAKIGYRAYCWTMLSTTSPYGNFYLTADANNNQLHFYHYVTTITIAMAASESWNIAAIAGAGDLVISTSTDGTIPSQNLIRIDEEQMLVLYLDGLLLYVERGYNGTPITTHAIGANIYQYGEDVGKLNAICDHTFYCDKYADIKPEFYKETLPSITTSSTAGDIFSKKWWGGGFKSLEKWVDDPATEYLQFYFDFGKKGLNSHWIYTFTSLFPKTSISGTVIKQYLLVKSALDAEYFSDTGHLDQIHICLRLLKDNVLDWGGGSDIVDTASVKIYDLDLGAGFPGNSGDAAFNNVQQYAGADGETDIEVASSTSCNIASLSDLSSTNYSLAMHLRHSGTTPANPEKEYVTGNFYFGRFGFKIGFTVVAADNTFYWRGKTRIDPGTYFNGTVSTLIEEPSTILQDFCQADAGLAATALNETAFDALYAARSAWKNATTIYQDVK